MKGDYVKKLIDTGVRIDGRSFEEFRPIKIEKGIIKTAEGSARVTIGKTKVLAGIKIDIHEPYADTPNEGNLIVSAEFVPFASPEFEPGPPGPEAVELARVVDRGIRESKALDTEKLVIVPGEQVWAVHIDLDVHNHDGNLIDAAALAAIAALQDAKLPKYDPETKNIARKGNIVISSEKPLPLRDSPVEVTVAKIAGKLLLDPTAEEEIAMDARLTIATTQDGKLCAAQKGGTGYFTKEEILKATDLALEKGKELRSLLAKCK